MKKILALNCMLVCLWCFKSFAQNPVINEKRTSLTHDLIHVKGSNTKTTTNIKGNVSLSVQHPYTILIISRAGLASQEVTFTGVPLLTVFWLPAHEN